MKEVYTIEEVARMSALSTRTIRNYLSLGLLDGEKQDGVWQFTAEQFSNFLRQDMVRQSVRTKANSIVYDFLLLEKKSESAACVILDLPIAPEAEEQLRSGLMDRVNAAGLQCSYHYSRENASARVILAGSPDSAAKVIAELR